MHQRDENPSISWATKKYSIEIEVAMSQVISIQEAAAILLELIKRASEGETVLIGDEGQAEVSLHAIPKKENRPVKIVFFAGKKLEIADDFDAPLPDDIPEDFGYNLSPWEKNGLTIIRRLVNIVNHWLFWVEAQ